MSFRVGLLCVVLALAPAAVDAQQRRPSRNATPDLIQILNDAVDRHDTPGVVGLVVDQRGVMFEGAAGFLDVAHKDSMPVNAIFNIASMTKPITSVAIMILLEQGKLALDDPVSKYLPDFDNLQVITKLNDDGTYETRPAATPMTLRHLLTHTSGLGYGFANASIARMQHDSHKNEWQLPLLYDPGVHWTYGPGTRVLGLIVEKISGQTLEAFDQEHIFRPLFMSDTSYAVPADKRSRLVTVYDHVGGAFKAETDAEPVPLTPKAPFQGDGGLYSTAYDYGLFMRMLLNGGRLGNVRILSEQSMHEMAQNQIGAVFVSEQVSAMPELAKNFPLGAGRDKFGLGFEIAGDSPDTAQYRSAGSLSWAGIYNTEFWIDPSQGIGGVLLMQYLPFYDEAALRTLRDFEAVVYKDLAPR